MIDPLYAAGFFDGEGCINLMETGPKSSWKRPILRLMITNTFPGILEKFKESYGGNIHWYQAKGNRKIRGTWSIVEGPAVKFLETIKPYLIVKAKQSELAIQFWELVRRPYAEKIETIASPDQWCFTRTGRKIRKLIKHARPEYLEACKDLKNKMGQMNLRGQITATIQ